MRFIAKFLLWIFGWKLANKPPKEAQKCVLVSGPHTSNWDTFFASVCMHSTGIPMRVAIKKFWMKFPQRLIIGPIGGLAIDTENKKFSRNLDQIKLMSSLFEKREKIALMISPEGNRELVKKWKLGFLLIAQSADVPVVTAYLDYDKKEGGFGPVFSDLSDKKAVLTEIMKFYNSKTPKFPEKFSPDFRYIENNELITQEV